MASRISVIIPTYNRADLIGETIDTVLAQSRPVDEIVIVDDGSTDETCAIIRRYGDAVRYIRKENGGKSSALNAAMAQTTGDLIWICDDDDLLEPDACARLAGALDADLELGYCAGRHDDVVVDAQTGAQHIKAPGYWRDSAPDEIFPDLLDGCHIFQPGLMVRRSVYDAIGPFNTELTRSQDYEMMLRIARHARGNLLLKRVFLHREHAGDRGSATERFSIEQATEKWIKFHALIMGPLMADLRDDELLPATVWNDPDYARQRDRMAKVKRGCVYARHYMWDAAIACFDEIARENGPEFNAIESGLLRAATLSNFGCAPLYAGPARADILALKRVSPRGRDIVFALARSLHWRLKQAATGRDAKAAFQIGGFIAAARV